MISILNIFQPSKILIGGGISKEGDYLLNPLRDMSMQAIITNTERKKKKPLRYSMMRNYRRGIECGTVAVRYKEVIEVQM